MIRLFVPDDLDAGGVIALGPEQAHYLRDVMRRGVGDEVLLFNGRDGEWLGAVAGVDRRTLSIALKDQGRAQTMGPDLELVIALVKRSRLETIIEKATELGARRVRLAVTRFTQADRTNLARLGAIAIEAAEQTGRLDTLEIVEPAKLEAILDAWPSGRVLIFCDEAGDASPILDALTQVSGGTGFSIVIGPEGGFSPAERERLRALPNVIPVSLGPRILRADTAAIAALALWQSKLGDWRP